MKKPLSVKILEWWFGGLAGLVSLVLPWLAYKVLQTGQEAAELIVPAIGLCVGVLFFWGLFLAVRRGQWACVEFPCWGIALFCLVPALADWRMLWTSQGRQVFLLVGLLLAGGPSVLFHLPASRLWFKARRGERSPGYGCGCLVATLFLLLAAGTFLTRSNSGRNGVLASRGREAFCLLRENEEARAQGLPWVDPNACSNAVEFLTNVQERQGAHATGRESLAAWTVVVNPPKDVDSFPLLFTANVDPTAFPAKWDSETGGDERLALQTGLASVSAGTAVVIRSNGVVQILKGKYASRKDLLGASAWQLDPATYLLTPTGKIHIGRAEP